MRASFLTLAIGLGISSSAQAAPDSAAFAKAAREVIALADAAQSVPGASPALAVVIVRGSGKPIVRVSGRIGSDDPASADPNTPFYIASMTKAYVGLLAAELDRKKILPLDTTLDDIWPGLTIPNVPNAGSATMRELLSHRVPFRVETLNYRTAYTDEVPASAYRALMEGASEPHDAAFSYSNLGYLIYGAAAQLRTGRHWRDLLKERVLRPLELSRTSPVISDFPTGSVTLGHQWLIDGFAPVGKSDALMHAAGGIVSSPNDMATWLQAWLNQKGGSIPSTSFELAATPLSFGDETLEGIRCTGYALGWRTCDIGGGAVHLHGGGYTGVRAVMAWSRDYDAGFALLSNSDSMTGGLSAQLTRIFFSALADPAFEPPSPEEFGKRYGEMVRKLAEGRKADVAKSRSKDEWQGWKWKPGQAELQAIAGTYSNPYVGDLVVAYRSEVLTARLGELELKLEPAAPNLFAVVEGPVDPLTPMRVETDSAGRPLAISWNDERFVRSGR